MLIYENGQWKIPKYKITRTVITYDDRPELYPDGVAEESILTIEQQARLDEIRYTPMAMADAESYVVNGLGTPPDTRTDIDKLIDLIPEENLTEEVIEMSPTWEVDMNYGKGRHLEYLGVLYKVIQPHKSQADWTPDKTPALFAPFLTSPTGEVLPWVQPESTNPYQVGDKVTYKGITWTSKIDANVTIPDGDVPYNRYWTDK